MADLVILVVVRRTPAGLVVILLVKHLTSYLLQDVIEVTIVFDVYIDRVVILKADLVLTEKAVACVV